jgi:acyl-CoA thioester hydrolase
VRPEAAGSAARAGNGVDGHRVQVRWRDLDGLGHVNHTVVLTYLEEGRDAWLEEHGISRDEYVVGRCSVNFRHEIDPAFKTVTVQCAVRELGRSSLTTSERIVDDAGQVVVDAEFGLVLWDPQQRGSRPITDEERASLEEVSA